MKQNIRYHITYSVDKVLLNNDTNDSNKLNRSFLIYASFGVKCFSTICENELGNSLLILQIENNDL
jgi:hypothetical protein